MIFDTNLFRKKIRKTNTFYYFILQTLIITYLETKFNDRNRLVRYIYKFKVPTLPFLEGIIHSRYTAFAHTYTAAN